MGNTPNNPYDLNIHGFPATKPIGSYDEWNNYAIKKINAVFSLSENNGKSRMKISEFLETPQFAESKINSGPTELPRVKDKVKDPLPPHDGQIDVPVDLGLDKRGDKTGVRRSKDYLNGNKRREWGFREKVLQGYPEYKPFFSNQPQPKFVAGIVTAGSGVFSGIPSTSNIKYTPNEVYRSVEKGTLHTSTENPMIPTGLCFIQDETGGLGIALGSDIRYIYNPLIYKTNFANPDMFTDEMHMGSIVIPKADYRQFLRVGDLVIIEVGTNFKYWHAILGSEPRYWEELWVPDTMKVDTVKKGSPQGISIYTSILGQPINKDITDLHYPKDLKGNARKPYVDNWGAHTYMHQNHPYVHPDFIGRDLPPRGTESNPYGIYPIQEDHPWSTGTPIPVNTGMPYIMMEQFMVDETERIAPTPLVITASDLRGFPKPQVFEEIKTEVKNGMPKLNIVKNTNFDSPEKIGWVPDYLAWFGESSIWTSNPGSKYKGMLVQLKNVRFVQPPKKRQLSVKLSKNGIENFSNELDTILKQIQNGTSIEDISIDINSSRVSLKGFKHTNDIIRSLFLKHNVDTRGLKIDDYSANDAVNIMSKLLDDSYNWEELFKDIALFVADSYTAGAATTIYNYIASLTDQEDWDDEVDGNRSLFLQHDFLLKDSPFPKSVDEIDGGYWWANPNIPLTNGRSHYKDHIETTSPYDYSKRSSFTQLVSSNKLTEIPDRFVKDLGSMYTSGYAPFADEWKPSVVIDGNIYFNNFEPIPPSSYFLGNRIYYVVDEYNVVVPIRINSNTEIARYEVPIPTGPVDITGIAWQYSLGTPGLEWEREAYMMQIWPRFASDISKTNTVVKKEPELDKNSGMKPQGV
jgi:hypothetical protein